MPVPLDEYPIHQLPLSLAYVGTSDRNFVFAWLGGIAFVAAFFLIFFYYIIPLLYFRH